MGNSNVPRFFQLKPSKQISFKVKGVQRLSSKNSGYDNSGIQNLGDGNTIPDYAIPPRKDFNSDFTVNENSKLGVPKNYTPEQIYNYKSNYSRYEKGFELIQSGKVLEDKDNPGDYKVLSNKAPKGYWEVKKKTDPDPDPDPDPGIYKGACLSNDVFVVLGVGAETYNVSTNRYAYDHTPFVGSLSDPASALIISKDFEGAKLQSAEYSNTENAGDRFVTITRNADRSIGTIQLLTDDEDGDWSANVDVIIYVRGADANKVRLKFKVTWAVEETHIAQLYINNYYNIIIPVSEQEYEFDLDVSYDAAIMGFSLKTPRHIVVSNLPVNVTFEVLECYLLNSEGISDTCKYFDGTSPGDNGDGDGEDGDGDDGDDGNDGDDGGGENGDGVGDDFECNCPDASKEKYLSPTETSGNELLYQSWKDSDAGAQDGICKHVWALRILFGWTSFNPIPTDMPIEISPFPGDQSPQVSGNDGRVGFKNWQMNKTTKGDKF